MENNDTTENKNLLVVPIEDYEQTILLTKQNGVWIMENFTDYSKTVNVTQGTELVVALIDPANPFAASFVDGPKLGQTYNSLYISKSPEAMIQEHDCFNATKEDILNILDNEGLILALSPHNMPKTQQLVEYAQEHGYTLSEKM